MHILDYKSVREVHRAAVNIGLAEERNAVLAGIDERFIASLTEATTPSAQLWLDLMTMNRTRPIDDGTLPLAVWLSNALTIAGVRSEAAPLSRALAECEIQFPANSMRRAHLSPMNASRIARLSSGLSRQASADNDDSKPPHVNIEIRLGAWFIGISIGSMAGVFLALGGMTAATALLVAIVFAFVMTRGSNSGTLGFKSHTSGLAAKSSMSASASALSLAGPALAAILTASAIAATIASLSQEPADADQLDTTIERPEFVRALACDETPDNLECFPNGVSVRDDDFPVDNAVPVTAAPTQVASGLLLRRPPPTVKLGSTSISGRLPPESIYRVVNQRAAGIRTCFRNGDLTSQGQVRVRFVINRDGVASNIEDGGSTMPDSIVSCVLRSFNGISFPQPEGGVVTVVMPITFRPNSARADVPVAARRGRAGDVSFHFQDAGMLQANPEIEVGEDAGPLLAAPKGHVSHGGLLMGPKKPASTIELPERLPDDITDGGQ